MQLAIREWSWTRWRGLVAAIAFGALLGVMGPFGSQSAFPPSVRYPLWMMISLAGFGSAAVARKLVSSSWPGLRRGAAIMAVAATSAVPMTFFVAWMFGQVQPGRTFSPVQLVILYPLVALVQLLIAWVLSPERRMTAPASVETSSAAPAYPDAFLSKLPIALRRDILALEAEDHYVRVHTRHGSALVLMRLADAQALIDRRLGLRVHRSWWVAKDAVRALEPTGGQTIARLVDGTAVPISRTHLPAARTALAGSQSA